MKYVYLVCNQSTTLQKVGCELVPFTESEISKEIEKLRLRKSTSFLNVLHCCSSAKKAIELRDRFNGIDEYRYSQFFYKNSKGSVTRIDLNVYDYYIVCRVLG